jgi:hypothetical protein
MSMSVTLREEMTNAQGDPQAGRWVLLIVSNIKNGWRRSVAGDVRRP